MTAGAATATDFTLPVGAVRLRGMLTRHGHDAPPRLLALHGTLGADS